MNPVATNPTGTESSAASDGDVARAIALLSEGLVTRTEFHALTGIDPQQVPQYLGSAKMLAAVQRMSLDLRNSGAIARLEALRHARGAVETAADIMQNVEMHPSTRLNAATFIAKVSGTERPAAGAGQPTERHTIVINIGRDRPPIVISSEPAHSTLTLEGQSYDSSVD